MSFNFRQFFPFKNTRITNTSDTNYVLLIIDMQTKFLEYGNDSCIPGVKREIEQAIKDDANIIFVEYIDEGDTIPELTDLVKHFTPTRVHKVVKPYNDGSKNILQLIQQLNLPSQHFKVVGVNTDCCVLQTVSGLKGKIPKIKMEVIADACASAYDHRSGLVGLRSLGCTITNEQPLQMEKMRGPYDRVLSIGDPV